MPRVSLPTYFKEIRTYAVQLTKTTEEDLKEHMRQMSEVYETRVQPRVDEQKHILELLNHDNPYTKHNWRKGTPERRFKNGFDAFKINEKQLENQTWSIDVARDFAWCLKEFKWEDDWVREFQYNIERTQQLVRDNHNEIMLMDQYAFNIAKQQWKEDDAEWIARKELKKAHEEHKPKSYYIDWFKKDKDAEKWYKGQIPDNEDTCEFCIHEKKMKEEYEEKARKEEEEYERQREESEQEYRRREEERKKNEKPVILKEHKCETCSYKTMDGAMFRVHLMSKDHLQREKQKNLYCEHCDHQCRGKIEYEAHIRTNKHKKNAGEVEIPDVYTCETCEYSTSFKHHYQNHLKSKKHMTQEVVVPTTA